jgi:hypothetical protein
VPVVVVRIGVAASCPEGPIHFGFLDFVYRRETVKNIMQDGDDRGEGIFLACDISKALFSDVSSGSIGLVVGMFIAFA